MNEPTERRLCDYCYERLAKRGRTKCNLCYKRGVARLVRVVDERPGDEALEDTGLVIDDAHNELVHPDGTRQWPVPAKLVLRFWFEPVPDKPHLLRVLRPAGPADALNPAKG